MDNNIQLENAIEVAKALRKKFPELSIGDALNAANGIIQNTLIEFYGDAIRSGLGQGGNEMYFLEAIAVQLGKGPNSSTTVPDAISSAADSISFALEGKG